MSSPPAYNHDQSVPSPHAERGLVRAKCVTQDRDKDFDGFIEATLEIARRDAEIRRELKAAILRDDLGQALRSACRLVGIEPTSKILKLGSDKAA
jgi:hypothetical protein